MYFLAVIIITDLIGPRIVVKFLISEVDDTAVVRQLTLIQILQIGLGDLNRDGIIRAACRCSGIGDLSCKVLGIVAIPHLDQTSECAAHSSVVQIELLTILPVDIVQTVNIRLVDLLVARPRNTFQSVVLAVVNECLSARYPHNKAVCAGLTVRLVRVGDRNLLRLHIDHL